MIQTGPGRLVGLDICRGLAILLMVFSHGLHWLYTGTSHDLITLYGSLSLGDAAMSMFFTVSGLSLYLSATAHLKKGIDIHRLYRRYRTRFKQLFLIGFCISLFWSVLQAQALVLLCLSSIYLYCLPRLGGERSRLVILGVVFISLTVHRLAVTYFDYAPFLIFFRGQFPFFALLGLGGLGFFSSILLRGRNKNWGFVFAGGALIGAARWLFAKGCLLLRFDASPVFIIFGFGLTLFCIGLFNFGPVQKIPVARWLVFVGRDALFLFLFHYAVFSLPLHIFGLNNRLGPLPALAVSGIFVAVIVSVAQRRRQSRFSLYQLTDQIFAALRQAVLTALHFAGNTFTSPARSASQNNPSTDY